MTARRREGSILAGVVPRPALQAPRYALAFAAVLLLGLVFGLCAREAREAVPDGFDESVRAWIDAEREAYPRLTFGFRLATRFGDLPWSLLACGAGALMLGWLGRRGTLPKGLHEGAFWLITLASGLGLNVLLKLLFQRERPPLDGRLVHVGETSFSFPSGHSAFAGLFFGLLGLIALRYAGRARWAGVALCVLAAMAIAFSRVWLGVHYLSDVLGGLAVGLGWAIVAWRIHHRMPTADQSKRNA